MSFSSYIRQRARVSRSSIRRGTLLSTTNAGLGSILEEGSEPETSVECINLTVDEAQTEKSAVSKKTDSVKARRRLGVTNLEIPRSSPLFTVVQGLCDASEECLRVLEPGSESLPLLELDNESKDEPALLCSPIPMPGSPLSSESEWSESESSYGSGSEESSEGSRSGSESPVSTGMPKTPTEDEYPPRQRLRRCKNIDPLMLVRRPSSSSYADSVQSSPAPQDTDISQDDDEYEYYASHACDFAPPPASSPSTSTSTSTTAVPRRQSAFIVPFPSSTATVQPAPHRASVRLSRAFTIPARAPPPPPINTSGSSSSSSRSRPRSSANISISVSPSATRGASLPSASASASSPRPPPRTPVPTDLDALRLSEVYGAEVGYTADADAPFAASPSLSSPISDAHPRLAALLSPPSHRCSFPEEVQVETEEVQVETEEEEEGVWEECALEDNEYEYDEVPLSPLAPSLQPQDFEEISFDAGDLEVEDAIEQAVVQEREGEEEEGEQWTVVPSPYMGAGWCPPQTPHTVLRPRWSASTPAPVPQPLALRSRRSASTSAFSPRPAPPDAFFPPATPTSSPPTPSPALRSKWSSSTLSSMHSTHAHAHALRSRWSSSTLSSMHSAHAQRSPASVKRSFSFAQARRYFPLRSASSISHTTPESPSPSTTPKPNPKSRRSTSAPGPVPRKKQRKLTVADVQVQLQCASPDVFSIAGPGLMTPASAPGSPASPALPLQRTSSALYAAYRTQRSPRRRASAGGWSQASSSASSASASTSSSPSSPVRSGGSSESGHSECSSSSSNTSVMSSSSISTRRKPIPVEMFLR